MQHTRKRSIAFLDDTDTTTTLPDLTDLTNLPEPTTTVPDAPSKRLLHNSGAALPTTHPPITYHAPRLLNALAFTRLYVSANFHAWQPAASPTILCCVGEQGSEAYQILCHLLPSLYIPAPTLQALAVTAGYLPPNAVADQHLAQLLPLHTTSGLERTIAEDFDAFRQALGPGDCIALIGAAGDCVWTSREAVDAQSLRQGLADALVSLVANGGGGGGEAGGGSSNGDVAMTD